MRRAVCLIAVALALTACGGPPPARTQARLEQATFTIGFAEVGRRDAELARAAALAAEQLNADGGVGGAVRLELVLPDEAAAPGDVARRLVQRGVQALILSCDPDAAREQADVAQRTQVLAIEPCNDDPALPSRFPAVWPVSLPANAEAAALADFALTRGYTTARVVGSTPFARYFRAAAPARDIRVADDGEVVVSALSGQQTLALDVGDRPVLGSHLLDSDTFAETAWPGTAFTTYGFPTPNSAAREFYRAFEAKYSVTPPGSWVALGYDAVRVVAKAIEEAGSADPDAIAEQLGRGLTVEGALSEITYPGGGSHNPETSVAVVETRGGFRKLVEKSLPEDVPAP